MDKASALEYINQMFPTEASLSGVEPLMQKIHGEICRVDSDILAAVRQQSNSGNKAKEDLGAATSAVKELMYKIREIKTKAQQSETMVQEICRDIKKLDFAKKHITTTITALHRLSMLVSAIDQLQVMALKRQYKEASVQLEAVSQLCGHFEAYNDVPKITEIREKFKNIKQILKSHVFSDFSSLGTGKENEDSNLLQHLSDACLVVDALEPSVREELVKSFCSRELISYQQIFEGAELAKLDKTERRYAWIKRRLRTNEESWKIFPASWHVEYLLCIQFCKLTKGQLVDIFNNLKEKPDVGTLLLALQRTLEFEEELVEKFGGGGQSRRIGSEIEESEKGINIPNPVSDIRKKYEKKLQTIGMNDDDDIDDNENDDKIQTSAPAAGFNFHGIISSCFEPHMSTYIELEEKTLMENLEKLVQEESWEIEEGSQTSILSSSMQLFLIIRRSLKRCSALTKNETLLNLFKVFQRILKAYASKLLAKLPKDSNSTQTKASDRIICYIVNTSEYCHKTSGELAENVSKIINPQFAVHEGIDITDVQDEFSAVITKALVTLVHNLEVKFDSEMSAMTRVPWGVLESVGDQSEYVNGINSMLSMSIPIFGTLLSPIYFEFFLDKLASSLAPRFFSNIFKCKQISETGAQQMLLDTQAVKTILLEVPSMAKQRAPNYSMFVSRELGKAEALLKVILSPIESVGATYGALLPEGTLGEFLRILELKGLKKTEQQSILDEFTKCGASITGVASPITPGVTSPIPPSVASLSTPGVTSAVAVAASKEDVLTRAAALGTAAAATGFKKFLALTDAAKDRKEGPFRMLFNP